MNSATEDFVEALANRFPALLIILEEHLEDQYGETLPHVYLGEVTRWLVERLRTAGASDRDLLEILTFLERAFGGSEDEVQDLIAVSFLENLPRPGEPGSGIRSLVGPLMREELGRIG